MSDVIDVFVACTEAIERGDLIHRESAKDKEFHFQNWFQSRLDEILLQYDDPGRNTYPDFRMVGSTAGFEVKGLGYPGREANYDCNSQVPSGSHNGRTIYYVFGRYPASSTDDEYPVLDLVMCHGNFLNAHHEYIHKNKSFTAFGSYGDIMIRDRKMYVAPTPFGLTDGTSRQCTLILPEHTNSDRRLKCVGELLRRETDRLVAGYSFDMATNVLTPTFIPNPAAGTEHKFFAFQRTSSTGPKVTLKVAPTLDLDGDE